MSSSRTPKMRPPRWLRRVWQGGGFLLIWLGLNGLINLRYPAKEPHLWTLFRLSPDIWILLAVLCLLAWLRCPARRVIAAIAAGVALFLRLFRFGDILLPMYFNRSFNLYQDLTYVPKLFRLLHDTLSLPAFLGVIMLSGSLLLMAIWGLYKAFSSIQRSFRVAAHRLIFLGISAVLLGIHLSAPTWLPSEQFLTASLVPRMLEEFTFMLHVGEHRQKGLDIIRRVEVDSRYAVGTLERLKQRNVYLFFLESYGHTVFADPERFAAFRPVLERVERSLSAHGFHARSHFMTAATFGGASWLSHATIATGVRAYDQMQFEQVLHSQIKPLPAYFNDAGYRTISVMPNTTTPWPEGAFFQYQHHYYARDFPYAGPEFGWATMADQFVLDYIFRQEIQRQTRPVFIEYVLVSSHAPFNEQPPYIEEWERIGDGALYHQIEPVRFPVIWPDLTNASDAYIRSLRYEMEMFEAYLTRFIDDDALIILLGDHQPNVQITGENSLWSVPVHVISRDPELLDPFAARGYVAGLIPNQPLPHPGMETFLPNFLQDFSEVNYRRLNRAVRKEIQ